MGIDPKQQRALRSGDASPADQPRDTSRAAVRRQEQEPPVEPRERPRRTTAAVPDLRVNLESATPVERLARSMGAEELPEAGKRRRRSDRRERAGNQRRADGANGDRGSVASGQPREHVDVGAPITPDEAERTLRARREHSKGDGDMPAPEPHAGLRDERPADRMPRDLPKARDDRSAPKGNTIAGQVDRNPALDVRDDFEPRRPEPASGFARARSAALRATAPEPGRRKARPTARRSGSAKRKATTPTRPRRAAANVRRAPKSALRGAKRAAVDRRPQVGKKRTGTATRRDAVGRSSLGNIPARRANKAKTSRAKDRRQAAKRS